MDSAYQIHQINWQGIPLSVACCADWSPAWHETHGYPLWHLTIRVDRPLPISETGFRSHFVSGAVLDEWGGPLPYIRHWLNAEAATPEWQARKAEAAQLSLFLRGFRAAKQRPRPGWRGRHRSCGR